MRRWQTYFLTVSLLVGSGAAQPLLADERQDLYFGEALYYAHQGLYFEALERLDSEVSQHGEVDEPELDSLFRHIDDAEFSLGDFELRYRMHHRAGRAIQAVLEGSVDEVVRNDAAFRLARIHFQKNQLSDAMLALDRINGNIPKGLNDNIDFLRASTFLAQGRAKDSLTIFDELQSSDEFGAYSAYNLGIAYLQDGQRQAALEQLGLAGQFDATRADELAIRDKSNLVLGTILLEDGEYLNAADFLNRVRLDGPYSNQALLSAGWANLFADEFDRAIVPWGILANREVTDRSTQEAKLALPYAYGKLDVHGRAAIGYGDALDGFGWEVEKLDSSIESIREGKFLKALIREEIQQDKDWVVRLRSLPDSPETYYLMSLLASHDFQTGLQNYLDLADLRKKLITWQSSFDSFDDIVEIRYDHYEPLLPEVDNEFRALDSRMRLRIEQHEMLVKRRDDLLTTPRPKFLATEEERAILARIEVLESELQISGSPFADDLQRRIDRLKGLLTWTLETEYHARLSEFDTNLRTLDAAMAVMTEKYESFVRSRQAATHSYAGYDTPVKRLRMRVAQSIEQVDRLMAQQGRLLETVAVDELIARRDRLDDYRNKARYALADSYDRATQAQARRVEP
jgi:hypothetical protein